VSAGRTASRTVGAAWQPGGQGGVRLGDADRPRGWALERRGGGVAGDRLDRLLCHCADLGIEVEFRDLGAWRRGEYHRNEATIVLSSRLTGPQLVACLAHELGHERFGHDCSSPANERRAWDYAAALVIAPDEYAAAEARVGPHACGLAIELAVTPRLVEAWQRWWVQRGRTSETLTV
jgi:hypothetical protein